jgi:hypothetical protein
MHGGAKDSRHCCNSRWQVISPLLSLSYTVLKQFFFQTFSISGFVAARILTDYFTKVIIVETDLQLVSNNARVGQRNQLHCFQPISLEIMRTFFPNFDQHAKNAGIIIPRA